MSSFLASAWPWALTAAGFMALIIIHELGHFFAAKATGMRVEQLSLFFGPKVVRIRRGETEYCIGTIPAGGYAKITGMNPDEELPEEVAPRAFYRQPVWKRIVVIGAGPAMNLLLAFALLFGLSLWAPLQLDNRVGEITPGTPAAQNLKPGDRILAVDGRSFPNATSIQRLEHFSHLVARHRCPGKQTDDCKAATPVHLRIERDGRVGTLELTPVYDAQEGRTRIGFSYASEPLGLSAPQAADHAAGAIWQVTTGTVGVFGRIFESQERKKIHGIVGISDVAHQQVQLGVPEALILVALVSLSLAIINLFPFLPLDGGHIFWSLVEKVRGQPVPFSVIERASAVGFVLVMALFVVGLSNDISRLAGGGFNVR